MIKVRLYFSESYQGRDNQPCYFTYITNGGIFITSPTETSRLMETPTFDLNEDNVDSYAGARGFEKVLEKDDLGIITYFNGYDSPEKREAISGIARGVKESIFTNMRFSPTQTKAMFHSYCEMGIIEHDVW